MASPDRVGVWRASVRFGLLLSYSRFDLTDGVRSRRSAPYSKPRFDPEKMLGHGSAKVGNATGSGPQTEIAGLPHPGHLRSVGRLAQYPRKQSLVSSRRHVETESIQYRASRTNLHRLPVERTIINSPHRVIPFVRSGIRRYAPTATTSWRDGLSSCSWSSYPAESRNVG